jgi:hypothetical protein
MPLDLTGPNYALVPVITCDRGRIWLQPYWTVGGLAFADQNRALRCVRESSEREAQWVLQQEQAEWEKMFLALPDDNAKREALITRLKAKGLKPFQIDDIVEFYESREWGRNAV